MFRYIVRRVLVSIPVLLLLAFAVFALMRAIPGGPFDFSGEKLLPEAVRETLKRRHHLDWSLGWQFVSYVLGDDVAGKACEVMPAISGCDAVLDSADAGISKGLVRGDLGIAFYLRGRTVNEVVKNTFPISLQLGLLSVALAVLIGIPAGTVSALKQNTWVDYLSSFMAILGLSIPNLVMGPL